MATTDRMKSAFDTDPNEAPPPEITILSGRTLDEVVANQPEPIITGGLAVRRNTTMHSGGGGLGKTTLQVQMAIEASLQMSVFGVEEFRPVKPLRVVYINAEDSIRNVNYTLGRLLPAYGLKGVPYDEVIVSEQGGRMVMDEPTARELARRFNGEGYDFGIYDPAIALLPPGIKFIDPGAIRDFLHAGIGHLQRETNAAHWLAHHDNKAGVALSGPADWANFARLALHLEPGELDGQLVLQTIKSNLGYRFKKITLERDPATGRATAIDLERFGDRRGKLGTVDDAIDVLSKLFRTDILCLPSARRTKDAVRAALFSKAAPMGVKRAMVRDFVDSAVEFDERKVGKTWCKIAVRLVVDAGDGSEDGGDE